WAAGRLAILSSALIGAGPAAVIDVAFLCVLGAMIAREIVAGKNYKNLRVLAAVGLLVVGNIAFHIEAATGGGRGYGTRIGLAATILLISL
ncbi:NnrS family protein, partial [Acinetobacter baumannii]